MPVRTRFEGNFEDIENIADAFREAQGYDPTCRDAHGALCALVKGLGGRVVGAASDDPRETGGGSLCVHGEGDFTISLSPYTSMLRDNFTIAHELGHFFLHCDPAVEKESVVFNRYGSDLKEFQANRFAAALLMPRDEFVAARQELNDDPWALAGRFSVSAPAVKVRMQYVGNESK